MAEQVPPQPVLTTTTTALTPLPPPPPPQDTNNIFAAPPVTQPIVVTPSSPSPDSASKQRGKRGKYKTKDFRCDLGGCKKSYTTEKALKEHMQMKHSSDNTQTNNTTPTKRPLDDAQIPNALNSPQAQVINQTVPQQPQLQPLPDQGQPQQIPQLQQPLPQVVQPPPQPATTPEPKPKKQRASKNKMNPAEELAKLKDKSGNFSQKQVDKILELLGEPDVKSNCLKKGIQRRFISPFEPNGECRCISGKRKCKCSWCGKQFSVSIRSVLKQPDYAGTDYEDGMKGATAKCSECGSPTYITLRMCEGKPAADSGKSHNHCDDCPGLGKCIGDYREAHCDDCGKHYFSGLMGGECSCQGRGNGDFDSEGSL